MGEALSAHGICHLPKAEHLLHRGKKKDKLRDDRNKKYPSQLWELPFQLSDGNAFHFSMNFAPHRKIPFLPVDMALPQPPCPPKSFPWGEVRVIPQNDSSK